MNMDIVLTTDANYAMPCGVMMLSLCKSNMNEVVTFHIVCDESVNEHVKAQLKDVIKNFTDKSIIFYYINGEQFNKYPNLSNWYLSKAAYYRLFLTEILPDSLDKVLYLDCDLLVLQSLGNIWDINLKGFALAAIIDSLECYNVNYYNRLRYSPSKLYFNSGVMLVNLKYWRDNNALAQFMNYLRDYSDRIVSHDQDILNVVFQDSKLLLPIKFNLQEGFLYKKRRFYYWDFAEDFDDSINNPVILHYTVYKPWQKICKNPKKDVFFKYQDQTVWKGSKLQKYPVRFSMKHKLAKFLERIHLKKDSSEKYIELEK